ncbi:hypothetical protein T492DRAFT_836896 [Pavlovales sp. CCMP2436]|nr:hypothetical protein T492DRAFT_836896 [Pavlovales sp. CCMP2436]
MSVILQLPKSAQYAGYMFAGCILPHSPVLYLMETSMFVLAVWIYSSLWKGYQDFEFEAALAAAEEAAAETDRAAHLSDGSGSSRADSGSGVGGSGREGGKGVDRRALLVRLKKESSLNLLGVDSLKRAIESVTDRIEARQASARRVALWVPCMCRDEVPLVTLGLMVLTCALIWAAMLSSIYMHTGAFAGMVTVNDLSDSILRLPEHRPLMTDLGVFNGSDAAIF